jgi:TetR/AcrR family transcriptional repressor of nem operon
MARPKFSYKRNTKAEIIKAATAIAQTKGFHALTYQDLADRVKIRKASIHYYFPAKVDLGVDILESTRACFDGWCQELEEKKLPPLKKIEAYFDFFHFISGEGRRVCPCGAFSILWPILTGKLQKAVRKLTVAQIKWLKATLHQGGVSGDIVKTGTLDEQAQIILASLQGGLQTSRTQGDPRHFREITRHLLNLLSPNGGKR